MRGTEFVRLCVMVVPVCVCVCVGVALGECSSSYRTHSVSRKWLLLPQESTIKRFFFPLSAEERERKIRQFNNKVKGDSTGTSCRRSSGTILQGGFGFEDQLQLGTFEGAKHSAQLNK